MPEQFLHLPAEGRSEIINHVATRLALTRESIEKDVLVCWALETLFTMPDAHPMAFKGGTSLSKVYGAIQRFSEDVDVTLDYREFDDDYNPFAANASRTAIKKYSDRLKSYVREYANTIVLPHIQDQLKEFPYADEYTTEISNDGEKIWINYPSVVKEGSNYIKRHILVELGGRNVIDPNERHTVVPDAATIVDTVDFPSSEVIVLSPERTFWEKATLIHVECNRTKPRNNYNRFSRHWYDMVKMSQHDIGKAAINNRKLLEDVINHKQVFFYYSHANYEACQKGELNLIPNGDLLSRLHSDYEEMLAANMMYGEPPSFDELMDELNGIEQNINGC